MAFFTRKANEDEQLQTAFSVMDEELTTVHTETLVLTSAPSHTINEDHHQVYEDALEEMDMARDALIKLIADAQSRLKRLELSMDAVRASMRVLSEGELSMSLEKASVDIGLQMDNIEAFKDDIGALVDEPDPLTALEESFKGPKRSSPGIKG